jgi:curved DNA-binding protein CbpA
MHAYRPNHYEALGVARSADTEAIRTAWRAHAKQLHPDLSEGQSKEAFLRLQEAYDVLRDPERRAHYDDTLARQSARRPLRPQTTTRTAPRAAAAPRRRMPSRSPGLRGFLADNGLAVLVTAGIAGWQLFFAPEPQPTVYVKVGRDNRAPKLPADPGILTREVDRAVQAQIERVEAAKKRMAEQLSELDAHKPAPTAAAPGATPAMVAARVQCIGRGTNIVLVRDNDSARVSYDNGPAVQPRISDLGTGSVLVSRIEPSNRIAIGFTKGDRTGTTLLMFDEAGRVQQTFPIECTAAAF